MNTVEILSRHRRLTRQIRLTQVIYEKLEPPQKEAFLDIAVFCRYWDWRIVERIVGKPQIDALVDLGLVHAKLRDTESFSGIAHFTRYSEQPWRTHMVMMHDLLYAIACRRACGNRVHSEDQTHLPDRLLMDSPGTVRHPPRICVKTTIHLLTSVQYSIDQLVAILCTFHSTFDSRWVCVGTKPYPRPIPHKLQGGSTGYNLGEDVERSNNHSS